MGLGKTVTLLGLLLSHKKQGPRIPRPDGEYFYIVFITSNFFYYPSNVLCVYQLYRLS